MLFGGATGTRISLWLRRALCPQFLPHGYDPIAHLSREPVVGRFGWFGGIGIDWISDSNIQRREALKTAAPRPRLEKAVLGDGHNGHVEVTRENCGTFL